MIEEIVKPGECAVSIALENQLNMDDLTTNNEALFATRTPSTCLVPGDIINLPETTGGIELTANTDYIIEVSQPSYQMIITIDDCLFKPVANVVVKCAHLEASEAQTATSDEQGKVCFTLPLSVEKGLISFEYSDRSIIRPFYSGRLAPSEHEIGMKQRLRNLSVDSKVVLDDNNTTANTYIDALANELNLSAEQIKDKLIQST